MIKKNSLLNVLLFNILLLVTIYTKNWWIAPLILFYFFWILYKYNWKIIGSLLLVILLTFSINFHKEKPYITPIKTHTATVTKIYNSSIVVKENGERYYLMKIEDNLIVGDEISFNATYKSNEEISSFDVFYRSTKTNGLGYASNLTVNSHKKNLRNNIYSSLLEENSSYSDFTLAMLYKTETEGNSDLLNNINILGVSHLFVVSGFHISILYLFIEKAGKKITKKKGVVESISFGIVAFFLYLIYFPPTGIRALATMFIIKYSSMSRIDSLSTVGIGMFIFNPFLMIGNSMILSFSITAMIYEMNTSKSKKKETFFTLVVISTSAFFLAMPTILTWNSSVNLFAPLLTIILTPIISFSYIVALLILPFHQFWGIFSIYFFSLNKIISLLSILYIPLNIGIINSYMQIYLTVLTFVYIVNQKNNKVILFNTFIILSLLFIII